jgi:hypothetical protein
MRKSELSAQAIASRDVFIRALEARGWRVESWNELFDAGADIDPEAEATYSGPRFDLHLEFHASSPWLLLVLVARAGDVVLRLRVHPGPTVTSVLKEITDAQDELTADNMSELVKALIPLSEPLLIETDDGLQRLSL